MNDLAMPLGLCSCCSSSGTTHLFQRRLDAGGQRVELFVCTACTAITNRTNLLQEKMNSGEARQIQISSADEFYSQNVDAVRLEQNKDNISTLNQLTDNVLHGRTMIDLGAGEGYLAAAACDFYAQAWAVDINTGLLDKTVPQFGLGNRLKVAGSLEEVPGEADAIFMWHTLEHIPDANGLGRAVAGKIRPGGHFVWQVPMYRDPYVVMSHYTFFNDHAARVFTRSLGLEVVSIFHDEALQFLTVVSRKPAMLPGASALVTAVRKKPSLWKKLRG